MAGGSVSALSLLRPAQASLAFTAHRIAQPSKTAFVTTLQPCQLPNYVGVSSFARSRVGTLRKEMEAMKTEADWNSFGDVVNKHKYFYWTVGTEDCGYSDSKAVWELYRKNSINVASEAQPGNHEWLVWRPALRDFAMKHFWSRIWTKRRVLLMNRPFR
jgi:hypothetical protein